MKKQSYIYYLFWVLLLIEIIITVMIGLSRGMILPLAIFPGMSLFFLFCLRYLLGYNLKQSPSEPLFVLRRSGHGCFSSPFLPNPISLSWKIES